ncbi:unnamed protein product [Anisakis simplex]|uniref:Uncharacterized protein n=1 Tax=Anisakis simplex TaxID=6269 RepID=A0A3P6P291_ANISI|nr:unnamed protein product [Anisakis simplex]
MLCSDPLFYAYPVTYTNTAEVFKNIIDEVKIPDFRILIYNGDVDTVCNFLGDAWHFRDVANITNMSYNVRTPWMFRGQVAGYQQQYTHPNKKLTMDVITVKGAGHFVPLDRAGPSLQMITNLMQTTKPNYSSMPNGFNPDPILLPLQKYPPNGSQTNHQTTLPVPKYPPNGSVTFNPSG